MGVLHALCNNREALEIGGWVKGFYDKTQSMNADDRAAALEMDDDLDKIHDGDMCVCVCMYVCMY